MYKLYYSSTCEHCQRLFRECNTNGIELINVNEQTYPQYVVNVPTLEDYVEQKIYIGTDVFEVIKNNNKVEPFEFDIKNNMSNGFSYIGDCVTKYSEQQNFSQF